MVDPTSPSPYDADPTGCRAGLCCRGWPWSRCRPRLLRLLLRLRTAYARSSDPCHEPRKVGLLLSKGPPAARHATSPHPERPHGCQPRRRHHPRLVDRLGRTRISVWFTGRQRRHPLTSTLPRRDLTLETEAATASSPTREQQSGGGGRHVLLLTHPGAGPNDAGRQARCRAGYARDWRLHRSSPSRHQSGGAMSGKPLRSDDLSLADAPTWLLTRLQAPHTTRNGDPSRAGQIPGWPAQRHLDQPGRQHAPPRMTPKEIYAALARLVIAQRWLQPSVDEAQRA